MSKKVEEKLIKKPADDEPLTEWEQEEWMKCARDKEYFFSNYVWVQADSGRHKFIPRPYQKRIIDACDNNRFVVGLAGRQSGKCCLGTTKLKLRIEISGTAHDVQLSMEELHEISKSKTPKQALELLQSFLSNITDADDFGGKE